MTRDPDSGAGSHDGAAVPPVYPWVVLGTAAGLATAGVTLLAIWATADDPGSERTLRQVLAVTVTPVLLGTIVGLGVGQFIRVSGIVRGWTPPPLPTVGDAPSASSNGHGAPEGRGRDVHRDGALFGVLALVGALLAGPVFVPMLPAPLVLGVGALALDDRVWVRVVASAGLFVASVSLLGFLATTALPGGRSVPTLLLAVVSVGVLNAWMARRVRPG